mmetsp:Transcript_39576/g.60503  ORF Transcript_39576/g.60503 Transcript_39576/m.60503 type:complete len:162 (+) Transcript_39576:1714-2199(+)
MAGPGQNNFDTQPEEESKEMEIEEEPLTNIITHHNYKKNGRTLAPKFRKKRDKPEKRGRRQSKSGPASNKGWLPSSLKVGDQKLTGKMLNEMRKEIRAEMHNQMSMMNQGNSSNNFPLFSSNTIQNLTINAQPGFNIMENYIQQLTQMTNNPGSPQSNVHY